MTLDRQRCFNHAAREAAARCPACGRFFCRECVTEHDDRVLCAACIESLNGQGEVKRRRFSVMRSMVVLALSFFLLFLIFYYTGFALMRIPSEFHKGGLW